MKIAIFGRKKDTGNDEKFVSSMGTTPISTLNRKQLLSCDGLLLPGGGDITPAFFGEHNTGSRHIDTELDLLQLQALDYAIRQSMPVLGICKGMQIINVAFGGTIIQDLPTAHLHRYPGKDQYHTTELLPGSCLANLLGNTAIVNSAHHQGIGRLGNSLTAIQWCPTDSCVEAIVHETLPILGLQWHPERLDSEQTTLQGSQVWSLWLSLFSASCVRSCPEDLP